MAEMILYFNKEGETTRLTVPLEVIINAITKSTDHEGCTPYFVAIQREMDGTKLEVNMSMDTMDAGVRFREEEMTGDVGCQFLGDEDSGTFFVCDGKPGTDELVKIPYGNEIDGKQTIVIDDNKVCVITQNGVNEAM